MGQKFFIGFNEADCAKAHWIAWTLKQAGYEVAVHDEQSVSSFRTLSSGGRHCEEAKLTKQSRGGLQLLDCFASLAMTPRFSKAADVSRFMESLYWEMPATGNGPL